MSRATVTAALNVLRQLKRDFFAARAMLQATLNGESHKFPEKLTGRAFYESIGSPTMIVAPMVDRSEFVRPPCNLQTKLPQFEHLLTNFSRPGDSSHAPISTQRDQSRCWHILR